MSYSIYTPSTYTGGNLTIGATGTSHTSGSYILNGANGTNTTWADTTWTSAPVTITQKATIDLKGEGADVVINGESLNETLKEIKQALRIPSKLSRDPNLEKDWDELQAAGDHYNKLLKEYQEKSKVWDTLKNENL